jgi:hypothetical protein
MPGHREAMGLQSMTKSRLRLAALAKQGALTLFDCANGPRAKASSAEIPGFVASPK